MQDAEMKQAEEEVRVRPVYRPVPPELSVLTPEERALSEKLIGLSRGLVQLDAASRELIDELRAAAAVAPPPPPQTLSVIRDQYLRDLPAKAVVYNRLSREAWLHSYERPADDTPSRLPERVTGYRFSAFIDSAEVADAISFAELVVSAPDPTAAKDEKSAASVRYYHGYNPLVDMDTARVLAYLNAVDMTPEVITGCVAALDCQIKHVVCHHCDREIAMFGASDKSADSQGHTQVVVCDGCHRFARYCSESCARRAWILGHHLMCPLIAKVVEAVAASE
ncbi:MAG: zinc finger MYND domain-containing protein [Dehalococcoidia bacterium]|nr:zinc finger MYND domain-containing protein [Dehalococcoidia bacterium]